MECNTLSFVQSLGYHLMYEAVFDEINNLIVLELKENDEEPSVPRHFSDVRLSYL